VSSVETTGLAWAVRSSFRRYVRRAAVGSEILDGGAGAISDVLLYFPVREVRCFRAERGDAQISFSGGVRFLGHAGMIDLRLGEFDLELSGGTGLLRTGTPDGLRDLVDVEITQTRTDGTTTCLSLTSRLAAGAEPLFDDVYAAGTPFDDLEIRITVPA
jgi:hypothetical protein